MEAEKHANARGGRQLQPAVLAPVFNKDRSKIEAVYSIVLMSSTFFSVSRPFRLIGDSFLLVCKFHGGVYSTEWNGSSIKCGTEVYIATERKYLITTIINFSKEG